MKRTSSLAFFALCSLTGSILGLSAMGAAASGCGVSPALTVIHVPDGEMAADVRGDAVRTRRGSQEGYAGLKAGFYVIRSIEDWRNAWPSGKDAPLPSTLDPARSMLLVAVADEGDNVVQVRIGKVIETGEYLHVFVRQVKNGQSCTTKPERPPFEGLVAPRIDKPVKFYVEDERGESCGDPPSVGVNCRVNNASAWTPKVQAQPGDTVECDMTSEARGKFALVDSALLLNDLPGGSTAKLSYTKAPSRGTFAIDVFGSYGIKAEAADESGRRSSATASVEVLPPKTKDVLVQLVWTNFDVSDDPETFPRVLLRATEEGRDERNKPLIHECSLDIPRPALCTVKTHSAYTQMVLKASSKLTPLDVLYVDERVEKGPVVCVQLYFDGVRTGETCDRAHRSPEERWELGVVDTTTGKLVDRAAVAAQMAAAAETKAAARADAGAPKPTVKQPIPKPPLPKPLPK